MTSTQNIILTTETLAALDLSRFAHFVPEQYRFFFLGRPGFAPYRLLAYFSTLFNNTTLVEIGVHNGWGSLALSYNPTNHIVGYDIDLSTLSDGIRDGNPRLSFREGIAHEMDPGFLLGVPLIHFDAQHDGVYEQIFFDFLVAGGFKGLLLLDDIHQNDAMKRFWAGITLPKQDLTVLGHETGTGLVYFCNVQA